MTRRTKLLGTCLAAAMVVAAIGAGAQVCATSANVSTFKGGLNNPRA